VNALMYHDVVPAGAEDTSGFPGRDAALYKVTPGQFDAHLEAIQKSVGGAASSGFVVTFDDGGVAAMTAADVLERRGLRGDFFVTANYIGRPGFLTRTALRELAGRGHRIGSHSCSHPLRMAHCDWSQLIREWADSRAVLSDVLSEDVCTGSIPGGDFAPRVAKAAAEAGYVRLFTSEPTSEQQQMEGLTLIGRYAVRRWTSARTAAALTAGAFLPCAQQALLWNARKLTKRLGGGHYLRLRRLLLQHGDNVRWGDEA